MPVSTASVAVPNSSPGVRHSAARDLVIALSLVNLAFLRVWSEILTYARVDTYLMKTPPPPPVYYAAIADVVAGGLILWGLVAVCRRYTPSLYRWVQIAFLASLALPLNAIREILSVHFPYLRSPILDLVGSRGVLLIAGILAVAAVWLIAVYHRSASRVASVVAFFFPFVPLTFGQAIWKATHYDASAYQAKLAPLIPNARALPRILWVICDEWDYSLTFEDRDPTLSLPEVDRLRQETLFASNAYPPGPATPISIPGYVTGKLVKDVAYGGPRTLILRFRNTQPMVPLDPNSTVFHKVRAMGLNAAVVGWFHPYCRLFQDDLVSCDWWELAMQHNSMGRTFTDAFWGEPRSLFETTLLSPFGQSLSLKHHAATHDVILSEAKQIADNPQYEFTYVHLPTPHAPFPYNRRTGRFDLANTVVKGYIDSLALLDRTLGELRQSMESAHLWDDTTVLITTDHSYRQAGELHGKFDPRIPFLLKLAGQHQGLAYDRPFNAILDQELLLAVLNNQVTDAAGAARWLDEHRTTQPLD